jgi:hypothetical protein
MRAAGITQTIPHRLVFFLGHSVLMLGAWLWLAGIAHAELLCTGSDGSKSMSAKCDPSYQQDVLTCDKDNVEGACAKQAAPMKSTPLKSFIKDYSPSMYVIPKGEDGKPYTANYSRINPGGISEVFNPIATDTSNNDGEQNQNKQFAACINQIDLGKPGSPEEEAKIARLQLDNCANQYILNSAIYPGTKDAPEMMDCKLDGSSGDKNRMSMACACQPMKTVQDVKNEYNPGYYMKLAWQKLLQSPSTRKDQQIEKEPHLPDGISLKSPLAPPSQIASEAEKSKNGQIRVSTIGLVPYEEINDPSHPFSPRWDFRNNERDEYSPKTEHYSSDTTNSVFCAGQRDSQSSGTGDNSKENQMVKVDILAFRRDAFNEGIMDRINFNKKCYDDKNEMVGPVATVAQKSYCYRLLESDPSKAKAIPCWKCFGLSGKSGGNKQAACSTNYSTADKKVKRIGPQGYYPGLYNGFSRKASCNPDAPYKRNEKHKIDTLCRDLRAPYAPINKLKMAYHNPDDEENITLKGGVPEGLTFKEYFGNHMPYPRLWDTGRSIQLTNDTQQQPWDTKGQYTAIVGVGRAALPGEAPSGGNSDTTEKKLKYQDQRCLYGGWGSNVSVAGHSIEIPDPVTSWTELKLYQARTLRKFGMSCLGRYETLFKPGGTEDGVLRTSGAEYTRGVVTTLGKDGTPNSYKDVTDEETDGGANSEDAKKSFNILPQAAPLPWVGYVGTAEENKADQELGKFANVNLSTQKGLDNAVMGDIVIMREGVKDSNGKPGLPKIGKVIEVSSGNGGDPAYVKVDEFDNGKWPDVCGTTTDWGVKKARYMYKGNVPDPVAKQYERIKANPGCEETSLERCALSEDNWNNFEIYKPYEQEIEGKDVPLS